MYYTKPWPAKWPKSNLGWGAKINNRDRLPVIQDEKKHVQAAVSSHLGLSVYTSMRGSFNDYLHLLIHPRWNTCGFTYYETVASTFTLIANSILDLQMCNVKLTYIYVHTQNTFRSNTIIYECWGYLHGLIFLYNLSINRYQLQPIYTEAPWYKWYILRSFISLFWRDFQDGSSGVWLVWLKR